MFVKHGTLAFFPVLESFLTSCLSSPGYIFSRVAGAALFSWSWSRFFVRSGSYSYSPVNIYFYGTYD